ncbi:MAG: hypothetical protein SAK29_12390 [Scytonema sp. PMC 1069.18]|nr:hypothetical protein [Scytonema sp. PMC 1069.18]MEC4885908.1 hypothetical protein [Scytonema sp. PMC 1070.18]
MSSKDYQLDLPVPIGGEDLPIPCDRLETRHPDAQIWIVRIGSRHVRRFGGSFRKCGVGCFAKHHAKPKYSTQLFWTANFATHYPEWVLSQGQCQ